MAFAPPRAKAESADCAHAARRVHLQEAAVEEGQPLVQHGDGLVSVQREGLLEVLVGRGVVLGKGEREA